MSNTNNTEFRLIEKHDIHESAEIQNNNVAQTNNDLLAERKSTLEKYCQYMRACRKDESSEQREKRIAKIRSYKQLGMGLMMSQLKKKIIDLRNIVNV